MVKIQNVLEKGMMKSDFNWVCTRNTAGNIKLFARHSGACAVAMLVAEMIAIFICMAYETAILIGRYPVWAGAVAVCVIACALFPAFAEFVTYVAAGGFAGLILSGIAYGLIMISNEVLPPVCGLAARLYHKIH